MAMELYRNLNRDSGVHSYELGDNQIVVKFNDRATYTYTQQSIGLTNLLKMKELATAGRGLNSYINKTPSVKKALRKPFCELTYVTAVQLAQA